MAIAGVDFSTHFVDIVLLDENTDAATWHRFELTGDGAFDRTRSVRAALPGSSFWDDVLAVGIEQPRGRNALVALGRIQGAILTCIPADKLVHPLNPSSWRQAVGLKGNASKAEVYERAYGLFIAGDRIGPWPVWPQDACDAYCIALATRNVIQQVAA